jgi:phage replication-related protein YjqB (UPF0714/DUF867 family)
MDKFRNFRELKRHEKEGADYEICVRKGSSGIAVMAPHGGGIEPGTLDIADRVAGEEHAFYCFKGMKKSGNSDLHITSDKFDEPEGIRIAEGAGLVLTIHGCIGKTDIIFVGGKDHDFRRILVTSIARAGFSARESERPELRGRRSANICNRGRSGKGGQVEISESLREKMFDNLSHGTEKEKNEVFDGVVTALRKALDTYIEHTEGGL